MEAQEKMLRLTSDKQQVLDENDNVVALAQNRGGKLVYVDAQIQTMGRICVRTETKSKKVCVEWRGQNICASWDWIEFEVCIEWSNE